MTNSNIKAKLSELEKGWSLAEEKKLHKEYKLKDFLSAINFINEIAMEAMEAEHHPEIINNFNKVSINLWTHMVDGLTDKDFNMAQKIDDIFRRTKSAEAHARADAMKDIEQEFGEEDEEEVEKETQEEKDE